MSIRNPECLVSNNQTLLAAINLGLSSFAHLSLAVFILSISPSLSLSLLHQLCEKAIEIGVGERLSRRQGVCMCVTNVCKGLGDGGVGVDS